MWFTAAFCSPPLTRRGGRGSMSTDTNSSYPSSSTEYKTTIQKQETDYTPYDKTRYRTQVRCREEEVADDGTPIQTIEQVAATVEYTVEDDAARLTGVYPDTTATGVDLHRETLKALRCVPAAHEHVRSLVDDDVSVEPPRTSLMRERDRGVVDGSGVR